MKSPIVKSTLREIKSTFGRYLAIIMIIALGVGFFAGLKVTRPAMLKTGQKYLSEADMYDFRLLSTLGYTDKEVEKLAEIEGVEYAVGSFSTDGVFDIGASEDFSSAHGRSRWRYGRLTECFTALLRLNMYLTFRLQ